MAKRTINLVLEVIIEIIEWFKTTRENKESGTERTEPCDRRRYDVGAQKGCDV
jgi:hypothetical protein